MYASICLFADKLLALADINPFLIILFIILLMSGGLFPVLFRFKFYLCFRLIMDYYYAVIWVFSLYVV